MFICLDNIFPFGWNGKKGAAAHFIGHMEAQSQHKWKKEKFPTHFHVSREPDRGVPRILICHLSTSFLLTCYELLIQPIIILLRILRCYHCEVILVSVFFVLDWHECCVWDFPMSWVIRTLQLCSSSQISFSRFCKINEQAKAKSHLMQQLLKFCQLNAKCLYHWKCKFCGK